MSLFDEIMASDKRSWDLQYGHLNYLPQKQPDGTYSPGIGHTGSAWPRGRGHDFCWDPYNCISCGCGPTGPGGCHRNLAFIHGWRSQ